MTGGLTNWAGNVTFRAARVHRPTSLAELQLLTARAGRLRALGTGHSFSLVADTAGDLVSVAGLPPVFAVDPASGTVTVSGGLRYGEITGPLHAAGRALGSLASLPHISVAGACATGTHGSGVTSRSLAAAVSAIEMVGAGGDLITLARGDEHFPAAVVALGALGIVTRLTLDTVPAFQLRQHVYENVPRVQLHDHLDEILSAAYSVSLFTTWRQPGMDQAWLKTRADDAPDPGWMGGRLAAAPRHPVPGMDARHCTTQLGVPGPWHQRLPHFRLDFTPSAGAELQSEYLVPRAASLGALRALEQNAGILAPVVQICEIRTVAADDLWLSPAYQRDSTAFHFTWVPDDAAVAPVRRAAEQALAPFAPRPHWAKLSGIDPQTVRDSYDHAADFQRLRLQYDPAGKFGNDFVDRYLPAANPGGKPASTRS